MYISDNYLPPMLIAKTLLLADENEFIKLEFPNNRNAKNLREGGDIRLFITQAPKFYNNVFLFVGFTTLGTYIEF